jgi:hypothetical protein
MVLNAVPLLLTGRVQGSGTSLAVFPTCDEQSFQNDMERDKKGLRK